MHFPCFPRLHPSFFMPWHIEVFYYSSMREQSLGVQFCDLLRLSCQIYRDDVWADFAPFIYCLIFLPYTYWPLRSSVKMTDTLPDVMGCTECNCRSNVGEKPRLSNILRLCSASFRQGVEIVLFSLFSNNFVPCIWLYPLKMWWLEKITAYFPQVSQCIFTMGKWWCTNIMLATPTYTYIILHHWHASFPNWKSVWCLQRVSKLCSVALKAISYFVSLFKGMGKFTTNSSFFK